MGNMVLVEASQYISLKNRVKKLQAQVAQLPTRLAPVFVRGVKSGVTQVFVAGDDNYYAVDGLDVTAWFDFSDVLLDFTCQMSFSVSIGSVSFRVEIDGAVYQPGLIEIPVGSSASLFHMGFMVLHGCKGRHRYRLMVSSSTAATGTFVLLNRSLRLVGLTNKKGG